MASAACINYKFYAIVYDHRQNYSGFPDEEMSTFPDKMSIASSILLGATVGVWKDISKLRHREGPLSKKMTRGKRVGEKKLLLSITKI